MEVRFPIQLHDIPSLRHHLKNYTNLNLFSLVKIASVKLERSLWIVEKNTINLEEWIFDNFFTLAAVIVIPGRSMMPIAVKVNME